jgi:hypothetical protein
VNLHGDGRLDGVVVSVLATEGSNPAKAMNF